MRNKVWVLIFAFMAFAQAHANVALLLEEPYGTLGAMNPTGHAAVYLTQVCAASPTQLRRCRPGEAGVVLSRYHRIDGYDWLAIPLIPYLYAVDSIQQIPKSVDARKVAELRDTYRRAHLLALAPDDAHGHAPKGDWYQLVGSAYDRKLYGFEIETTPEQDAAFIRRFNSMSNRSEYSLFFNNCADFARTTVNFFQPHAIHRNIFADAAFMTPKQDAKSLVSYSHHHPIVELSTFQIPQVLGSIRRSKPVDFLAEGLLKSKKYVVPLAILSPVVTGGIAVAYLTEGRFNPRRNAAVFDIMQAVQSAPETAVPSAVTTSNPANGLTRR